MRQVMIEQALEIINYVPIGEVPDTYTEDDVRKWATANGVNDVDIIFAEIELIRGDKTFWIIREVL